MKSHRRNWSSLIVVATLVTALLAACGPKDLVSMAKLSAEDLVISDRFGNTVRPANAAEFLQAFKEAKVAADAAAAKSEAEAEYVFSSGGNRVYYDAEGKYLVFVDKNQKKTVYSQDLGALIAKVAGLPPVVKSGTNLDPSVSPTFATICKIKEPAAAQFQMEDKTVIMVAAGEKPTGGYTMSVENVTLGPDGSLVITVRVTDPTGEVTQAVTYPYLEILIPEADVDVDVRMVTTSPTGDKVEHVTLARVAPEQNIILFKPERGSLLTERVTMFGFARVFEGAFSVEVEDGHYVLGTANVQARESAPNWGYFEFTMELQPATSPHGMLIFVTESAKDGSRVEELTVPIAFGGK